MRLFELEYAEIRWYPNSARTGVQTYEVRTLQFPSPDEESARTAARAMLSAKDADPLIDRKLYRRMVEILSWDGK